VGLHANTSRHLSSLNPLLVELDEIKAALQRFTVTLAMTFVYYSMALAAGWTSEGAFCMTLERFRAFAANICVVDPLGKTCRKMNELDCVFVVRSRS